MVGHTHEDVDQMFSRISVHLCGKGNRNSLRPWGLDGWVLPSHSPSKAPGCTLAIQVHNLQDAGRHLSSQCLPEESRSPRSNHREGEEGLWCHEVGPQEVEEWGEVVPCRHWFVDETPGGWASHATPHSHAGIPVWVIPVQHWRNGGTSSTGKSPAACFHLLQTIKCQSCETTKSVKHPATVHHLHKISCQLFGLFLPKLICNKRKFDQNYIMPL